MYPDDTSLTTPVEVDHGHTLAADSQAEARPARRSRSRPKRVGYARTLFDPADLRLAVKELSELGVHSQHIYIDQGADGRHLPSLQQALEAVRPGDTLIAGKLARFARSLGHLSRLIEELDQRGVKLALATADLSTLSARHLLQLTAQFEADLVTAAAADGEWLAAHAPEDKRGGKPTLSSVQALLLRQLFDAGALPRDEVGRLFGVSRATAYRVAGPAIN